MTNPAKPQPPAEEANADPECNHCHQLRSTHRYLESGQEWICDDGYSFEPSAPPEPPQIPDNVIESLYEQSKLDHNMIVGSEVRQLIGEIRRGRSALAAERTKLEAEELAHHHTIAQRDDAEDCAGDLYAAVMGESAEWSNVFGYADAINDVTERLAAERAKRKAAETALREILAHLDRIGAPREDWYRILPKHVAMIRALLAQPPQQTAKPEKQP